MKTDYELTGNICKKLDAYTLGNCSQAMPNPKIYYYFGSSEQFKSCKNFKAFLETKYPNSKFKVILGKTS